MGDLVSRKAALGKALRHCMYCSVPLRGAPCGGCIVDTIFGGIKNLPAVDTEPVRHAKWEEYPDRAHIRCTGCRVEFPKKKMPMSRAYCPNCGAKMDKEAEK